MDPPAVELTIASLCGGEAAEGQRIRVRLSASDLVPTDLLIAAAIGCLPGTCCNPAMYRAAVDCGGGALLPLRATEEIAATIPLVGDSRVSRRSIPAPNCGLLNNGAFSISSLCLEGVECQLADTEVEGRLEEGTFVVELIR